ncbi:MAG: hypothetical protein AB1941_14875 [Gemmatimonadota bacterium]
MVNATRLEDAPVIEAFTFADLQQNFLQLYVPVQLSPIRYINDIRIAMWTFRKDGDNIEFDLDSTPTLNFEITISPVEWAGPWSIKDYAASLKHTADGREGIGLQYKQNDPLVINGFGLTCHVRSLDAIITEEIRYWSDIVLSVHEEATTQLIAAQHTEALTTTFHFPPAIATACEQYLLYFVQFLADLGIEAQAEVKHEAAEVLFRVTPTEGREALERVRVALDAYLRLPADSSLALVPSSGQDPAVWELKAVVRHLRDRLEFQQDIVEAKNATIAAQAHSIEALELSNFRLRQISGGEVQAAAPGAAAAAGEDDSEAIIPRAVSVKRYEIGPIVVEIPEILRMLKRRFGGDT